jgi:hypothetical protein
MYEGPLWTKLIQVWDQCKCHELLQIYEGPLWTKLNSIWEWADHKILRKFSRTMRVYESWHTLSQEFTGVHASSYHRPLALIKVQQVNVAVQVWYKWLAPEPIWQPASWYIMPIQPPLVVQVPFALLQTITSATGGLYPSSPLLSLPMGTVEAGPLDWCWMNILSFMLAITCFRCKRIGRSGRYIVLPWERAGYTMHGDRWAWSVVWGHGLWRNGGGVGFILYWDICIG